jgi:hypothetical protein
MLPLVVALEAFAEAAALLGEGTAPGGLRSVEAGDALRFFSEQPINARLDAERTEEGVACRLTSDLRDRQGRLVQAGRMHLSGAVELGPWNGAADLTAPWVPPTWTWNAVDYPDESAVIHHGPAFRCLRQVMVSEGGGWGKLMAPAPGELAMERGAESLLLPAAVLDASFFACGVAVWLDGGAVAIPHGLQRLRWGRLPRAGEECMLRLVRLRAPDQRAAFDFALFGEDGAAIAQVQRYEAVLVKG